jgi:hypothetical protein
LEVVGRRRKVRELEEGFIYGTYEGKRCRVRGYEVTGRLQASI